MDSQGRYIPKTTPEGGAVAAPASAPTSPLRSRNNTATFRSSNYGSLFRPVKSCANLEAMNTPAKGPERELAPLPDQPTSGFFSRSIFKSVKSCINLESMDRPGCQPTDQQMIQPDHGKDSSSGILFSSLKSFKVQQANMVSERDINLMAPMSS